MKKEHPKNGLHTEYFENGQNVGRDITKTTRKMASGLGGMKMVRKRKRKISKTTSMTANGLSGMRMVRKR